MLRENMDERRTALLQCILLMGWRDLDGASIFVFFWLGLDSFSLVSWLSFLGDAVVLSVSRLDYVRVGSDTVLRQVVGARVIVRGWKTAAEST